MKKLLSSFLIALLLLFGCSNAESNGNTENSTNEDSPPLDEEIKTLVEENNYSADGIIDYDEKNGYVFTFYYDINEGLAIIILDNQSGELQWLDAYQGNIQESSFSSGGSPVVTIVQPENEEVKDVKIFGESADLKSTTVEVTDDFSKDIKFWVAYSDNTDIITEGLGEEIEYIY